MNKYKSILSGLTILYSIYIGFVFAIYKSERHNSIVLLFLGIGILCILAWWKKISRILRVMFLSLGSIAICVSSVCLILIFLNLSSDEVPFGEVDYVVVLGNRADNDASSYDLKGRLDTVIGLTKVCKAPIIVSGGKSDKNGSSEATVMSEYLISNGVQNRIILESNAQNTKENIQYAYDITGDVDIVIVTSDYHQFRAKSLAAVMGYNSFYCVGNRAFNWLTPYYYLREICSIIREVLIIWI